MLEKDLDIDKPAPTLEGGRYVVAGVLGKGGNAGVYQAWDTSLRCWRAVKVLSHEFINDDQVRQRFAQEAATMARLDHPNLVQVYDISDDPYTPHIVMELCAGGTIIDWMRVHGAVPPRLATRVITSTARGVEVAHVEGIVHRDIKPQNILIDQKGTIKLTDFGIARQGNSMLTVSGSTIGTYAFMAPEQRHDSTSVDARADVYSLGATLYTLVAVKTTTELFVAERGDEVLGGVPDPIVDVILKACAYKPRDRFQSVEELVQALQVAHDRLPPDPPHPPLQALARPLPDSPPSTLPDLTALEGLLKSLALHDDTPTYSPREHAPDLDHTTLGTSATPPAERRVLPYYMPSHDTTGSKKAKRAAGERPSYLDPSSVTPPRPPERAPEPVAVAPVQGDAEPPWASAIRLGGPIVVVLLFGLLVFGGVAGWGAMGVNDARSQAAVEAATPALHAIAQAGGNAAPLESAWWAIKDAPPDERPRAAAAFARDVAAEAKGKPVSASAKVLLDDLAADLAAVDQARSDWEAAADSGIGALGVALGLAVAP
jgi:serine/threonine protein kinase